MLFYELFANFDGHFVKRPYGFARYYQFIRKPIPHCAGRKQIEKGLSRKTFGKVLFDVVVIDFKVMPMRKSGLSAPRRENRRMRGNACIPRYAVHRAVVCRDYISPLHCRQTAHFHKFPRPQRRAQRHRVLHRRWIRLFLREARTNHKASAAKMYWHHPRLLSALLRDGCLFRASHKGNHTENRTRPPERRGQNVLLYALRIYRRTRRGSRGQGGAYAHPLNTEDRIAFTFCTCIRYFFYKIKIGFHSY